MKPGNAGRGKGPYIWVPSQKHVGRDDGCHFSKNSSAELLGFGCYAPALVSAEAKSFVSELLPENPILLLETSRYCWPSQPATEITSSRKG